MGDLLNAFFDDYVEGRLREGIEQILPNPGCSYAAVTNENVPDRQLTRYIDEAVFGRIHILSLQKNLLTLSLESQRELKTATVINALNALDLENKYPQFISSIKKNLSNLKSLPIPFSSMLQQQLFEKTFTEAEIAEILEKTPQVYRELTAFQIQLTANWQIFKKTHHEFVKIFPQVYFEMHPWYPLKYAIPLPSMEETVEIPVIFFEPVKKSMQGFLEQLKGRLAIYVFMSRAHFFHMLSIPGFIDSLSDENHLIYITEYYPHEQFKTQYIDLFKNRDLKAVSFFPTKVLKTYEALFMEALYDTVNASFKELNADTSDGDRLFEIAKRILFFTDLNRLGQESLCALYGLKEIKEWYGIHKGVVPENKLLGPSPDEPIQVLLSDLSKDCRQRKFEGGEKIVLVHIVNQLIDGGHGPTSLIKNLVLNRNSELFDVIVICSEYLQAHKLEYPYKEYVSDSSEKGGVNSIMHMQQSGVQVFSTQEITYYRQDAKNLANTLNQMGIDIAVFHGPDIVNTMAVQMTTAPLRVLFEHGSQARFAGFNLSFASSEDAVAFYKKNSEQWNMKIKYLGFAVDCKERWEGGPIQRSALGIPEDAFVLTTISSKLDVRLTDEMLHTLGEILKRVPKAWYAPIGSVQNPERIKKIFARYSVEQKLKILGAQDNPSQLARSMHLYINEFPFGSGLGMLDAMAAGCPVISIYAANRPQQARYGGHYMGMDRVITSGKKEDYIDLACELLNNPEKYQEWSQHAQKQYALFSDIPGWVARFEEIVYSELKATC